MRKGGRDPMWNLRGMRGPGHSRHARCLRTYRTGGGEGTAHQGPQSRKAPHSNARGVPWWIEVRGAQTTAMSIPFLFPFGPRRRPLPFPSCLGAVTSWGTGAKAPASARWHCSRQSSARLPRLVLCGDREDPPGSGSGSGCRSCTAWATGPALSCRSVQPRSQGHWLADSHPPPPRAFAQRPFFHASQGAQVRNQGPILENATILTPTSGQSWNVVGLSAFSRTLP